MAFYLKPSLCSFTHCFELNYQGNSVVSRCLLTRPPLRSLLTYLYIEPKSEKVFLQVLCLAFPTPKHRVPPGSFPARASRCSCSLPRFSGPPLAGAHTAREEEGHRAADTRLTNPSVAEGEGSKSHPPQQALCLPAGKTKLTSEACLGCGAARGLK